MCLLNYDSEAIKKIKIKKEAAVLLVNSVYLERPAGRPD